MRNNRVQLNVFYSLFWIGLLTTFWVIVKSDTEATVQTTSTTGDAGPTSTQQQAPGQIPPDSSILFSEISPTATPASESDTTSKQSSPDNNPQITTSIGETVHSDSLSTSSDLTTDKTPETFTSTPTIGEDKENVANDKGQNPEYTTTLNGLSLSTKMKKKLKKIKNELKTTEEVKKSTSVETQVTQGILSEETTAQTERSEQVIAGVAHEMQPYATENKSLENDVNTAPNTTVSESTQIETELSTSAASDVPSDVVKGASTTRIVQAISYNRNPKILMRAVGTINKGTHPITSNSLLITGTMFVLSRLLLSH